MSKISSCDMWLGYLKFGEILLKFINSLEKNMTFDLSKSELMTKRESNLKKF